ncbi:anhydro-N-acetylmuramic acid kinase [Legionella israelensis]|uniref:Anhydro-N-acetylmuramic acid kinase n=1 Tax=Legionella israelensis TaxID=454 RepID=A0A0W0VH59_9GAMM|nr:anhydro-N-acetylmuramic acid kinase [Legionella israelensis]KTD19488.1 anhydro-N-acetylmuramic acid kinase [Legionella israelensis]QBS08426.1 anhydro-N-acetylmuramic acid kinase [Legionella israelensis]SCX91469.1 anhydro-N-acetylmuramic acid kinase [Legionella israelensis DSM 19235]STX58062.1 anhydro-N-acetylmuramic acid kinase [Legionella israelensis]
MSLYIGLMSGTSMDGIDAALLDVKTNQLVCALTNAYSEEAIRRLDCLQEQKLHSLKFICELNRLIGCEFAYLTMSLLSKARIPASQIVAIGSHGQTVCHGTTAELNYTMQLGCPHTIAEHTGITVVADFRTRDIVAGGQGAPFAPLYHKAILASSTENIAVVNLGGIANISLLTKNGCVRGWDVGPGNCLMDKWIFKHLNRSFDHNGNWAAQGKLIPSLLDNLLSEPFFIQSSPKSIGKEYFSLRWLEQYLSPQYAPVDVQATLLELTARNISDAILQSNIRFSKLYLCGGGAHNQALKMKIASLLPDIAVEKTSQVGISEDYLEAMMFAWIADKTIHHKAIDLSDITGSQYPLLLGAIYPANRFNR